MVRNKFVTERVKIARKLVRQLKGEYGKNILAIGVTGSVARGKAERYSDIDIGIIVKKPAPDSYQSRIINNTYCSLTFGTSREAIREITRPDPLLPQKLGGFTMIRRLYDPDGLLATLQEKANHVPPSTFHRSAELALLHSYEDFCRVKNAYLANDVGLLRDNVNYVTHSAALIVASLNNTSFVSDREIFKAYRWLDKLPRDFSRIEDLRYGCLSPRRLVQTTISFYLDLIDFCQNHRIRFPVDREHIQSMTRL